MPNEFPPPWEHHPFDWIRLSEEQAHRVSCAFSRRLDLRSLAGDALFFSLVLEGHSPHIDETARAAVRHYVDLTRLLLAALTPPDPLVAEHVNLRPMLQAGARADIQRLKLPNPPHWILEWAIT